MTPEGPSKFGKVAVVEAVLREAEDETSNSAEYEEDLDL